MNILDLKLHELKKALDEKKLSSLEVTNYYLERVEKYDSMLNSYLYVAKEQAVKDAKRQDELRSKGQQNKCAGVPIALKDLILTKDMPTTCASKMLEGYYSAYEGTLVKRLRDAGCVFLGKLNMDEFAMGSSGATSHHKKAVNPWNVSKVPGGSSSGSAAAMGARLAPITLGSDTGGSIRQPAGFCGVVGYKPSYGLVSRYGVVGYASSMDQVGPIAKCVEDAAFITDIFSGHDPMDSTSYNKVIRTNFFDNLNKEIKGLRLGLPKNYITENLSAEVKEAIFKALETYKQLGAEVVEIDMPHSEYALSVYQIIANAEASSNLARFDGIEFGYSSDKKDLNDLYCTNRGEGFGYEVKKRLIFGTYSLQSGQYKDLYLKATKIRRLIKEDYDKAYEKCDLIVGPTVAVTAFGFDSAVSPMEMYLNDLYTVALNLGGGCGISIPCGFDSSSMPIGLQLQGNMYNDQKLLNAAFAFEEATAFSKVNNKWFE